MHLERVSFEAVRLSGGQVLVAGNDNVCMQEGLGVRNVESEVWDPRSDRWTMTPNRTTPRDFPVLAALDDGRALLAGGVGEDSNHFVSGSVALTSLYDPQNNEWLPGPSLSVGRYGAAGARLHDGRILVAGGTWLSGGDASDLASAEIYDPLRNMWTMTGSMTQSMGSAHGVTLDDGRVLVVGTHEHIDQPDQPRAELYDPATARWTRLKAVSGSPVALPDGGALVISGDGASLRLDPETLRWNAVRPMPAHRSGATPARMATGQILVAGGWAGTGLPKSGHMTRTAQIFDPRTGRWSTTVSMPDRRRVGVAVALTDGSVLVIGGDTGIVEQEGAGATQCPNPLATAVRYFPAP